MLSVDVKPTLAFSSDPENDDDEPRDARDFVAVSGAMDKMVKGVWSTRGYCTCSSSARAVAGAAEKGTAAAPRRSGDA